MIMNRLRALTISLLLITGSHAIASDGNASPTTKDEERYQKHADKIRLSTTEDESRSYAQCSVQTKNLIGKTVAKEFIKSCKDEELRISCFMVDLYVKQSKTDRNKVTVTVPYNAKLHKFNQDFDKMIPDQDFDGEE